MSDPVTSRRSSSAGKPAAVMAIFVLVGAPMAYFVWHTLSDVLAGQVHVPSVLGAAVVLVVLIGLLRLMARYLNNL